jgi:hypothetical protein
MTASFPPESRAGAATGTVITGDGWYRAGRGDMVAADAGAQITELRADDHACLTFDEAEELFDLTAAYVRDGLAGGNPVQIVARREGALQHARVLSGARAVSLRTIVSGLFVVSARSQASLAAIDRKVVTCSDDAAWRLLLVKRHVATPAAQVVDIPPTPVDEQARGAVLGLLPVRFPDLPVDRVRRRPTI